MAQEPSLTDEQRLVLQGIYGNFRHDATWPKFITVDRLARRTAGIDTGAVVRTIPQSHLVRPRPGNLRPNFNDKLQLTLVGIASCEGSDDDVDRFIRLLRWLAEKEVEYDAPGGDGQEFPQVTSQEIREYLEIDVGDKVALHRLREVLAVGTWGLSGWSGDPDNWYATPGPEIWRFKNVQSVDDCMAVRQRWVEEDEEPIPIRSLATMAIGENVTVTGASHFYGPPPPDTVLYVNEEIIVEIKAKADASQFDCSKLLKLIDELNDNFGRGNVYSVHAILRAILDHVPPILGHPTFDGVASSYPWGRTDKNYMKSLFAFKDQGNDALHRRISAQKDLLSPHDVPPPIWINRLLQECVAKLG